MSIEGSAATIWRPVSNESLNAKYEKCRNITEEIYKRINITFQIKNLEVGSRSELSCDSDQIDSNDLSNGTDLFAYERDSISSTVSEREARIRAAEKYINVNNNEETKIKKSLVPIYKRPKKRFRKRVKKRQSRRRSESEGSSDEALPLSRIVDLEPVKRIKDEEIDDSKSESPDNVMGVPKIALSRIECRTKDSKAADSQQYKVESSILDFSKEKLKEEDRRGFIKKCSMCSMVFRAERGLRRHMAISHRQNTDDASRSKQEKT